MAQYIASASQLDQRLQVSYCQENKTTNIINLQIVTHKTKIQEQKFPAYKRKFTPFLLC